MILRINNNYFTKYYYLTSFHNEDHIFCETGTEFFNVIKTNSLRALNKEYKMFATFESGDINFW
jgi:hypothetical protein